MRRLWFIAIIATFCLFSSFVFASEHEDEMKSLQEKLDRLALEISILKKTNEKYKEEKTLADLQKESESASYGRTAELEGLDHSLNILKKKYQIDDVHMEQFKKYVPASSTTDLSVKESEALDSASENHLIGLTSTREACKTLKNDLGSKRLFLSPWWIDEKNWFELKLVMFYCDKVAGEDEKLGNKRNGNEAHSAISIGVAAAKLMNIASGIFSYFRESQKIIRFPLKISEKELETIFQEEIGKTTHFSFPETNESIFLGGRHFSKILKVLEAFEANKEELAKIEGKVDGLEKIRKELDNPIEDAGILVYGFCHYGSKANGLPTDNIESWLPDIGEFDWSEAYKHANSKKTEAKKELAKILKKNATGSLMLEDYKEEFLEKVKEDQKKLKTELDTIRSSNNFATKVIEGLTPEVFILMYMADSNLLNGDKNNTSIVCVKMPYQAGQERTTKRDLSLRAQRKFFSGVSICGKVIDYNSSDGFLFNAFQRSSFSKWRRLERKDLVPAGEAN